MRFMPGFLPWQYNPTFLQMIDAVGADASLDFCLDAAALASYDPNTDAQTWVDLTGNGNSFFRGATSGSDASDPTFNGVAGDRTENEYFSFDGGDFFNESAGHTFAESWHKDNATLSAAGVCYVSSTSAAALLVFANAVVSTNGIRLALGRSGSDLVASVDVSSTVGTVLFQSNNFGAGLLDTPIFFAFALDESVGAGGLTYQVNATRATDTSTYGVFVSSGSSSIPYQINAGNSVVGAQNGSRLYCEAGWSRRLSNTELDALYARLQRRYSALP